MSKELISVDAKVHAMCNALGAALCVIEDTHQGTTAPDTGESGTHRMYEIADALQAADPETLAYVVGKLAGLGRVNKLASPWPTPYNEDGKSAMPDSQAGSFWADGYDCAFDEAPATAIAVKA